MKKLKKPLHPLLPFALCLLACAALIGCKREDVAFTTAAKEVSQVKCVATPGSEALAKAIADRGGFPATSDSSTTKKVATDGDRKQFAVGYNSKSQPVVAVVVDDNGQAETVTDPDLLTAYAKKVRAANGKLADSENPTASGGGTGAPGAPGGGGAPSLPKGCPITLGMSKAAVDKKLGPPSSTSSYSNGSVISIYQPFDAQATAESEGAGRALGMMGAFGALARPQVGKHLHSAKTYAVTYGGGVVTAVQVDN